MPLLVRFYIRHVVIGYLLSAAFVALLLWLNVANLWHLVTSSDVGLMAVFLLVMFNGIVFSGVQFGIAVMLMGRSDPPKAPKTPIGRMKSAPELLPAKAAGPPRPSR